MGILKLNPPYSYGCKLVNKSSSAFKGEVTMLGWALMFFLIAVVAGIFGFGGIAGTAAGIAQILFFVFVILLIAALVFGRRVIT
jgi:uncharacterized membrane protein YtjA (UPF0391 family)